jgi:hypothetical protein
MGGGNAKQAGRQRGEQVAVQRQGDWHFSCAWMGARRRFSQEDFRLGAYRTSVWRGVGTSRALVSVWESDADAESDSDVGQPDTASRRPEPSTLPAAHWTARLAARMAPTVEWSMKLLSVVDEAQTDGAIARGLGRPRRAGAAQAR